MHENKAFVLEESGYSHCLFPTWSHNPRLVTSWLVTVKMAIIEEIEGLTAILLTLGSGRKGDVTSSRYAFSLAGISVWLLLWQHCLPLHYVQPPLNEKAFVCVGGKRARKVMYKENQLFATPSPLFIKINKYIGTICSFFIQGKMRQKETDKENTDQILNIVMNFAVILDVTQILKKGSLN